MHRVLTGRVAAATVASGVAAATLLAGCTATTQPTPAPSPAALTCTSPGTPVGVGASARDMTPGRFTVSAGTYRLAGQAFPPPAPVPLFPTDVTVAVLGPGNTTPTYDRERATVAHATMSVRVTKTTPAVLHLDAGSFWLVNTFGVSLELTPCDGGQITGVTAPTGRTVPTTAVAAASSTH